MEESFVYRFDYTKGSETLEQCIKRMNKEDYISVDVKFHWHPENASLLYLDIVFVHRKKLALTFFSHKLKKN